MTALSSTFESWPVAVIGAGPVGLAAAAHLQARGLDPLVLEAGPSPGTAVLQWGHVRLFSPWEVLIDDASAQALSATGWRAPRSDGLPTGKELVERYLEPLAASPALADRIRYDHRILSVSRVGPDRTEGSVRHLAPFVLRVAAPGGLIDVIARGVVDASGTWRQPNPLGASGVAAIGEGEAASRITYGIPDVVGPDRHRYENRRVLVVGSGHSAFNVLADLATLRGAAPGTRIFWAIRSATLDQVLATRTGGGLPACARLGTRMAALVEEGAVSLLSGFRAERVVMAADAVAVIGTDMTSVEADEIVVATGSRPDLHMLRELRLDVDDVFEAPAQLAPLVTCASAPEHGARELGHPEPDFYTVGMKSYGRAPSFLLDTGYLQVRSVVAALASAPGHVATTSSNGEILQGDHTAAPIRSA